jgi:hypothetical protein
VIMPRPTRRRIAGKFTQPAQSNAARAGDAEELASKDAGRKHDNLPV